MGAFDDLVPKGAPAAGAFDDLVPTQPGWGELNLLDRMQAGALKAGGGVLRMLAELPQEYGAGLISQPQQTPQSPSLPGTPPPVSADPMAQRGAELVDLGQAYSKDADAVIAGREPGFWQKGTMIAAESLPVMTASMLTGSAAGAPLVAGALSGGAKYGEQRAEGIDPRTSARAGLGEGVIEGATEYLPAKYMFNPETGRLLSRIFKGLVSDVAGEQVATAGQGALDVLSGSPDPNRPGQDQTLGRFATEQLPGEAVDTLAASLVMAPLGAGGTIANYSLNPPGQRLPRDGDRDKEKERLALADAMRVLAGAYDPNSPEVAEAMRVVAGASSSSSPDQTRPTPSGGTTTPGPTYTPRYDNGVDYTPTPPAPRQQAVTAEQLAPFFGYDGGIDYRPSPPAGPMTTPGAAPPSAPRYPNSIDYPNRGQLGSPNFQLETRDEAARRTEAARPEPGPAPIPGRMRSALEEVLDAIDQQPLARNIDVRETPATVERIEAAPAPADIPDSNITVEEIGVEDNVAITDQDIAAASRAGRLPPGWTDPRLLRKWHRAELEQMAQELVPGGGIAYLTDQNDKITGRTPSQNPAWFQAFAQGDRTSVKAVKEAIGKALRGEKLRPVEKRAVEAALDDVTERRTAQAEESRRFYRESAEAIGIDDQTMAEWEGIGERYEPTAYNPAWDGTARAIHDLAADAMAVDPDATEAILDSSRSDADVARALMEVTRERTQQGRAQVDQGAQGTTQAQGAAEEADAPGAPPSSLTRLSRAIKTATGADNRTGLERAREAAEERSARQQRIADYRLDDYSAMPADVKKRVDKVIAQFDNPAQLKRNLRKMKGTPWSVQALDGALARAAIEDAISGKMPQFRSALDSNPRLRDALIGAGKEALFTYLSNPKTGFIGKPSKPGLAVNSSFLNCDPSKGCAQFCYATGGNYQYEPNILKGELVNYAVHKEPKRAAGIAAAQYLAMGEHYAKMALRIFDKGDGNQAWLPFIREMNARKIRLHVFSKQPEFLRQVPTMNVRLLSVDSTNTDKAYANPDLPVAYVYTSKDDIKHVVAMADRLQLILPVQGKGMEAGGRTWREIPEPIRKAKVCPIDGSIEAVKFVTWVGADYVNGRRVPGTGTKIEENWNCTHCDLRGDGIGCYHGQTTKSILDQVETLRKSPEKLATPAQYRELEEVIENGEGISEAARERLRAALDAVYADLRAGNDPAATAAEQGTILGTVEDRRAGREGSRSDGREGPSEDSADQVTGPRFSRAAPTNRRGPDPAKLQTAFDELTSRYSGAAPVRVAATISDLPPVIRRKIDEEGAEGVEGVYHEGEVWMVAENLPSPERAARVYFHEVVGHNGLRGLFDLASEQGQKAFDALLDDVVKAYRAGKFDKWFSGEDRAYLDLHEEQFSSTKEAAEEFLARLSERGAKDPSGFLSRLRVMVARILRSLPGVGNLMKGITKAEVDAILAEARRYVESGQRRPAAATRFSRDITKTEAFRKWFGNSKVVDENGEPLVVYHGTGESFDAFDPSRAGQNSGHPTARLGVFLSADPAVPDGFIRARVNSEEEAAAFRASNQLINKLARAAGYSSIFQMQPHSPERKAIHDAGSAERDRNNYRTGANVMPVYAAIKNPLAITWGEWSKAVDWLVDNTSETGIAELLSRVKSGKHDGIMLPAQPGRAREYAGDTWIAFRPEQIKSATGNRGTFDAGNSDIRFSKQIDETFYSPTERAIASVKQNKATPEQWMAMLKKGGAKQEEMDWIGLPDFLAGKTSVAKGEIEDFVRENAVRVEEVEFGLGKVKERPRGEYGSITLEELDGGDYEVFDGSTRIDDETYTVRHDAVEAAANHWRQAAEARDATRDEMDAGEEYWREMLAGPKPDPRPRYSEYQLPGGENYRELLLTLPENTTADEARAEYERWSRKNGLQPNATMTEERYERETGMVAPPPRTMTDMDSDRAANYRSSHWDEPNILAHVRFNERTDADGARVLFIEEVQSDWHQAGRERGYTKSERGKEEEIRRLFDDAAFSQLSEEHQRQLIERIRTEREGVPDAPFKTSWPMLAMKRMIRYAAENGFDKIAWTTGAQQAERYDLSKRISKIEYNPSVGALHALDNRDNDIINKRNVKPGELAEYIGKEAADKLLRTELAPRAPGGNDQVHTLTGVDIAIGGEGMRGFYDRILPNEVNKYAKKWGARTERTGLTTPSGLAAFEVVRTDGTRYGTYRSRQDAEAGAERAGAGAKVRVGNEETTAVHALPITEAMRDSVMRGQPLFSRKLDTAGASAQGTLLDRYRTRAKNTVDTIDAVLSPLGSVRVGRDEQGRFTGVTVQELPSRAEYMRLRNLALGKVGAADEAGGTLAKAFLHSSAETKQQVYDYLTTAGAKPLSIKEETARRMAVQAKKKIGEVSDALVEAGYLNPEAREAHRDAYLPRLYLRHLLDENDYRAMGAGKKPSDMGYLKKRKDIPEEIRRVILGEIKDPGFLAAAAVARPGRDLALLKWLEDISAHNEWVLPESLIDWKGRTVTPAWLKAEAVALRRQAKHYTDVEDAKAARTLAKKMDEAADTALGEINGELLKDYRAMPDTPQFGRLRGMWVRQEIYDDIVGIRDMIPTDPSWAEQLFGYGGIGTRATQLFKMAKVALNPPGQVRNAVSNTIMLNLSGIPWRRIPQYLKRALKEIQTNGKYMQLAKKNGLSEATFSSQELYRAKTIMLEMEKAQGTLGILGAIHLGFGKVANFAGDAYQAFETMGKVAKMMHAMEREGMNEADAAAEAQRWLFDYSFVGRNVRYLRNAPIGMPFLTYQYKVLPRLIEVATLHPQRLLPYAALFYGMQYALAAALDVDDDDIAALKKALPKWLQERGHVMMIPYKDENNRWQFIDMGYFMPWSMYTEAMGKVARGDVQGAAQTVGMFGGPLPDIITALKTGMDPFTDRPIANEADPPSKQALDILSWMWSLSGPPFLTENGALGKLYQSMVGKTDYTGDPKATPVQALLRFVGLNTYAVDPEDSRNSNLMQMQYDIQDVARRLVSRSRQESDPERRAALEDDYRAEIERRADKMQKYRDESEVHPNLR